MRSSPTPLSAAPSIGEPSTALVNDLGPDPRELFKPVAEQLRPQRDDHPADVEVLVSGLIGLLQQIEDDAPMPGTGNDATRPSALMGEDPPGTSEDMLDAGLLALADSQRFRPDSRYVDCIRPCLPFCSPDMRPELERRVAQLEGKVGPPDWADAIWKSTAVGGWHGYDDLGDQSSIGVELSWPGNWPNQVLFGLVALEHGPFAEDFVLLPLEEYKKRFTPGTPWPPDPGEPSAQTDVIRHLEPMATGEAVGRLLEAMVITDLSGAPTAEDYFMYTPFAQQTLAGLPAIDPPEPTPATNEEREAMIRDFLSADGVASTIGFEDDPGFAQEVGEICELFVDYPERHAGGDRYRWSPMVVEGFLHHYGDNVEDDLDVEGVLAPVLAEWIRFCHSHKGWAPSITAESVATINEHLVCARGEGSPSSEGELPVPHQEQLLRLVSELGTDTDDTNSMQQLMDTWYANESWPEEGSAPVPWARIPERAKGRCQEVLSGAEPVLNDLMAPKHVTSARRMVADLAVEHTSDFLRGRADVWAAAVAYAVAQVHHAFDTRGTISGVPRKLSPQQLIDAYPSVSKASITSKAAKLRAMLEADGPRRARYDEIAAALAMLPYIDRDQLIN